jgi:hypothetical protein
LLLVGPIEPPKLIAATCRTSGTRSVLRDAEQLSALACGEATTIADLDRIARPEEAVAA